MNLLSLAERLAALEDAPPIRLNADQCLHARHRFSTCDACVRTCPTNALHLNGSITLNAETCAVCGECLHVCPTGALDGNDGAAELLNCITRLDQPRRIELACSQHAAPEKGSPDTDVVVRTNGCLAALGPSAYLSLLVLGVERVTVRLDACVTCPIGEVRNAVSNTLSIVHRVLAPFGIGNRVMGLNAVSDQTDRPVYDAQNPPLSRRNLFRVFAANGPRPIVRVLVGEDDQPAVVKLPSRERRRLINVLKHLPSTDLNAPLEGLPFARMTADDRCTACGVCARICPTGALSFTTTADDIYLLAFSSGACIDCGACIKMCDPGSLQRAGATFADVLTSEPVALRAGKLRSCTACGAQFAAETSSDLCPRCDFRRKNPSGSRLPPGLKKPVTS